MDRRSFLMAAASAAIPLIVPLVPLVSFASTSRMLTLEELAGASTYVVVGTARDQASTWEDLPSGRRIVTYTRFTIERTIAGDAPSEIRVRTLGGAVGKIGQSVAGEARLVPDARSMLFLTKTGDAAVVTAMAQGHYPITVDAAGVSRLASSPDVDLLVPHPGPTISARERLVGAAVEDAVKSVLLARGAK